MAARRGYWQKLCREWNVWRAIRLVLALLMFYEAWAGAAILPGIIGAVLMWQVWSNKGCCGTGGCDMDHAGRLPTSLKMENKKENFE